jgi:hypothetical protein
MTKIKFLKIVGPVFLLLVIALLLAREKFGTPILPRSPVAKPEVLLVPERDPLDWLHEINGGDAPQRDCGGPE